jgi:hypothetical protein
VKTITITVGENGEPSMKAEGFTDGKEIIMILEVVKLDYHYDMMCADEVQRVALRGITAP